MPHKLIKRLDLFIHYALAAARMAMEQSRLKITPELAPQVGVLTGCGLGGLNTIENTHSILLSRGPDRISPFLYPHDHCQHGSRSDCHRIRGQGTQSFGGDGLRRRRSRHRGFLQADPAGGGQGHDLRRGGIGDCPAGGIRIQCHAGHLHPERGTGKGLPPFRSRTGMVLSSERGAGSWFWRTWNSLWSGGPPSWRKSSATG